MLVITECRNRDNMQHLHQDIMAHVKSSMPMCILRCIFIVYITRTVLNPHQHRANLFIIINSASTQLGTHMTQMYNIKPKQYGNSV